MSVIGIDFGNMNSIVAQAQRGGIDIILNENSNRLNPSMVSFNGAQRFMGEGAASIALSNYQNTVYNMKRLIGRKWDDPELQEEIPKLPFKVVQMGTGNVGVAVEYNNKETVVSMEQVVAMLLIKIKDIAVRANSGAMVADVVVAVPTWYTDTHRRAMKNACEIAGLKCLRLMNETTATALSYGIFKSAKNLFDTEKPTTVLFVDMGHSNFSATVVQFIQGSLIVKSCVYDHSLGGRDMDSAIAEKLATEFYAKFKHDPHTNKKAMLKLLQSAERGKKQLSPLGVNEVLITVESVMEECDFNFTLSLAVYEQIISPLCERMAAPIQQALAEAGVQPSQLDSTEIVGGGTRVPAVKRAIAAALGYELTPPNYGLFTTMNADEAVARGCALQCAILSARFKVKEFFIRDAIPYPVKLTWDSSADMVTDEDTGENGSGATNGMVIFKRNEETPKTRRLTFKRSEPFSIVADYDDEASTLLPPGTNLHVAAFEIKGIPPNANKESAKIRVNVKHDIHGMIEISSAQMMEEIVDEEKSAPKSSPKQETKKEVPSAKAEAGETMDTAEGEKAPEDSERQSDISDKSAEPSQPKKRFQKRDLQVAIVATGLSKTEVLSAQTQEAQMAAQDKLIQETADKRNELETYIYGMRDKIIDQLQPYVEDAVKEEFSRRLENAEQWLYSDEGFDTTKAEYAKQINELKSIGDPIEKRLWEHSYRDNTVSQLTSLIEEYKALQIQRMKSIRI